jgi:hypothetical protein
MPIFAITTIGDNVLLTGATGEPDADVKLERRILISKAHLSREAELLEEVLLLPLSAAEGNLLVLS